MLSKTQIQARIGLLAALALLLPLEATGQQRTGVEIWGAVCGRCHMTQPPGRYTANQWQAVGTHMVITARLTTAQAEAVIDFLKTGARPVAAADPADARVLGQVASSGHLRGLVPVVEVEGMEIYNRYCTACHGARGEGDGIAAAAFDPRPADFTADSFQTSRTDTELATAIFEGKKQMPPFGEQLSVEEIDAVVAYLRTLAKD
jgi:cytochrome c5